MTRILFMIAALILAGPATAQDPFEKVCKEVNQKCVKLYGSGGFRGLTSYGTGVIVSPNGHILTAATQLLDTQDLRVHLASGRRMRAKVLVIEPELDLALLELRHETADGRREDKAATDLKLDFFDISEAAKSLSVRPSSWVLAFHNAYKNATRDEPLTVQHGVIAARAKLFARRGVSEVPFKEEVFFLDAITNNPGAAGGALTTRTGALIGIIGKEYRNVQSDTFSNYAIPVNAKVEVKDGDQARVITLPDFVAKGIKGEWIVTKRPPPREGPGAYTGIVFVPNVVEQTPPYIEAVEPGSPAAKVGLRPDDLVVYLDGDPIYSVKSFKSLVAKLGPGVKVKLEIRRGERLTAVDLELVEVPKN